ncbi:MAG TPA: hypothetical protein VFL76_04150 [Edaphocola sp.]|nr:hypothetical protein [Edaphocola sp.]
MICKEHGFDQWIIRMVIVTGTYAHLPYLNGDKDKAIQTEEEALSKPIIAGRISMCLR